MGDMDVSENVAEAVMATDAPNGTAESEVTELDKYWNAVRSNPNDFTGWTYLLQYVEQENKIEEGRKAFDEFLEKYPYCFGYWKKYADLEKRNSNNDKAEEVFERGVTAIPLSVDLWLHYIAHNASLQEDETKSPESTRKLFERALTACGTEFRSDRLWDTCVTWEAEQNQLRNVTALYDRVLTIPTQSYRHHYEQFITHARGNSPKDILTVDEFLRLRGEVVASRQKIGAVGGGEDGDDDALAPPGGADEAPPGLDEADKYDDAAELEAVREKLMEAREVVHRANEEEVRRRWTLEQAIKRPYFHVKPLEKAQLKAWKEYLDFEMTGGTHERTVVLFERCLIACALYDEFWIMYAKYMEPHSRDAVRSIYRRACTVHLTHKPSIHLAWAMLEECQGNFAGAKEVLQMLESKVPGLLATSLRLINLDRRQGNLADVERLYKVKIDMADKIEERSFYAVKFAHYLAKVKGDLTAAAQILTEALEKDEGNPKLYLQLIDLEYQRVPVSETAVMELFDKAISSSLTTDQRLTFSQRRLEFVDEFATSADKVHSAHEAHVKLTKDIKDGRKRKTSTSEAESSDAKRARTDAKAAAAAAKASATPAAAATQATAGGYGSYAPPPPPPPPQAAAAPASTDASAYGAQYMQYWPGYGYGAQYPQYHNAAAWAQYNTMQQQDYYHR